MRQAPPPPSHGPAVVVRVRAHAAGRGSAGARTRRAAPAVQLQVAITAASAAQPGRDGRPGGSSSSFRVGSRRCRIQIRCCRQADPSHVRAHVPVPVQDRGPPARPVTETRKTMATEPGGCISECEPGLARAESASLRLASRGCGPGQLAQPGRAQWPILVLGLD